MSSDNSTQEQWTPYQDFYDGCVNGLLPILFLTIYGPKPSPYLGKFAYFMDDVLVLGLLLFGPFTAMFFIEILKEKYILGLFSVAIFYGGSALIFSIVSYVTIMSNNYAQFLVEGYSIAILFQNITWIIFSFKSNTMMPLFGKIVSPILLNPSGQFTVIIKRIFSKELKEGSKKDLKELKEGSKKNLKESEEGSKKDLKESKEGSKKDLKESEEGAVIDLRID
ncbi:13847_t:CDS:2 [Rhizophagus irregularis]|nr:13847_t:CDS:2 [Rhizophagus irregularis]